MGAAPGDVGVGAVGFCCAKAIGAHTSSASAPIKASATTERPTLLCGVRRIGTSPPRLQRVLDWTIEKHVVVSFPTGANHHSTDTCGRKADAVSQRIEVASRCLVRLVRLCLVTLCAKANVFARHHNEKVP
jgi:hypothetical protein